MIKINTEEIERLSDIMTQITSTCDDVLARTKALRSEMELDPDFMAMPESVGILEILDSSVKYLFQTNDTATSLRNVILTTPEVFQDNEVELINQIQSMTRRLDAIEAQMSSAVLSDLFVVVDKSDDYKAVNNVEKLVSEDAHEMEITNVAAMTRTIEKETPITKINEVE